MRFLLSPFFVLLREAEILLLFFFFNLFLFLFSFQREPKTWIKRCKANPHATDPILYERLVKRHQSAAEREAEGRAKGYGRTLEADLVRGETKLATLRDAQEPSTMGGVEEAWDQPAETKAQGLELWRLFLTDRFVRGRDAEFAYEAVDGSEEYDGLARREAEEQWFDEEEPMRVDDAALLKGETGIQDF